MISIFWLTLGGFRLMEFPFVFGVFGIDRGGFGVTISFGGVLMTLIEGLGWRGILCGVQGEHGVFDIFGVGVCLTVLVEVFEEVGEV